MIFDLNTLWFVLICILYMVFFILEGFDFGVGMLLPLLGKDDTNRRVIINTIGPHWDGNEVWLITAGGATFAAFPHWYATMLSGFYLLFFIILLGLIVRGVAFEFRGKGQGDRWRKTWDSCIFGGSLIASFSFGVIFSNLVQRLPIDADMIYKDGIWTLINPYSICSGLVFIVVFLLHGAVFLSLKTSDGLADRSSRMAKKIWIWAVAAYIIFAVMTQIYAEYAIEKRLFLISMMGLSGLFIIIAGLLNNKRMNGWAFFMMVLNITLTVASLFYILYPRVMISSIDPIYSLTIYNASSSQYTLQVISIITLIFLPIVVIYQAWSYYIFRKRVKPDNRDLTY